MKLDIKELSLLNKFITIYNTFDHLGKINKLNINELYINELIDRIRKSLEDFKDEEDSRIESLSKNFDSIKDSIYDLAKKTEIKGNKDYYDIITNILLNELQRENNRKYKLFVLNELLLKDGQLLFIHLIQLLKIILEDYISSDKILFQSSLKNLSFNDLKPLENKVIENNLIKQTLIYTLEQLSIIYIENLLNFNEKEKKK